MTTPMKFSLRAVFALWLVMVVAPSPVSAHAEVLGSSPGSGQTVGGDVSRIDIVFAEDVTEATVQVSGPDGILAGEMVQAEGLVVAFGLDEKITAEGDYKVVFQFDSLDEDFVELEFTFTYEVGAPEPLAVVAGVTTEGSSGLGTIAIGLLAASTLGLAALLAWRYRKLASNRA